LPRVKEEQAILPTLTSEQINSLAQWKPRTPTERRLHALVCTLADTGLRISEALGLTVDRVDFDNLLLTVKGKGSKERVVPFSYELRRILWKYCQSVPRREGLVLPL
jgi:integrase/recombinase XerD